MRNAEVNERHEHFVQEEACVFAQCRFMSIIIIRLLEATRERAERSLFLSYEKETEPINSYYIIIMISCYYYYIYIIMSKRA